MAASTPRVLFYVQYLLGIGHVRRSALIVQALAKSGIQVDVIFGGRPVPHISFAPATMHFLDPVKSADNGFSGLVKADSSEFTDADKLSRVTKLLQICEQLQPDVIITETYPFGRRQMRFELTPLLEWARKQPEPPLVVSSIRDILQARSPKRENECINLIQQQYDKVLVHGDSDFTPLQKSFAKAIQIQSHLHYSGYVCPPKPAEKPREDLIVVSIGGGAVGKEILQAALQLHASGYATDCQWLLITGPNMAPEDKHALGTYNNNNLQVVDLADDFIDSLSRARVSVSMAGYNTVMDLLQTETPAVVVPFEAESETEQLARSQLLESKGLLTIVREKTLTAETLQHAIEQALRQQHQRPTINMQGAEHSANLLKEWAEQHMQACQRETSA
ncbi:glycosyltransferase family protein [Aliamphritea ceti]|uniref:glycosyltransferase family protein n=1 Tax=Aliamphritea ceti TaxID=1524258 RepID=UPI0021C35D77|nr:glycosyltransferase [Aliamphritea ceti]